MSNFLKTNDRLVNLKNVSNINILHKDNRIVFNLNYGIKIGEKLVSDYIYWDSIDDEDFQHNVMTLQEHSEISEFIESPNALMYININEISSVKFSDKKLRVIFNLSHSVEFVSPYDQRSKITSEFVYINCTNDSEYINFKNYVKSVLI